MRIGESKLDERLEVALEIADIIPLLSCRQPDAYNASPEQRIASVSCSSPCQSGVLRIAKILAQRHILPQCQCAGRFVSRGFSTRSAISKHPHSCPDEEGDNSIERNMLARHVLDGNYAGRPRSSKALIRF
jgi:hypothetical protein